MLLDLTDDETLLKSSLEAFARQELAPRIKPFVDRHEFPTELVKAFLALGFMAPPTTRTMMAAAWARRAPPSSRRRWHGWSRALPPSICATAHP